jgi:hypothetical protein
MHTFTNRVSHFSHYILIFILLPGLVAASLPPHNLIANGSFERGLNRWQVFGSTQIVHGVCGNNAVSLRGTLQSQTVQVRVGKTYRVSFQYRGSALRATVLMNLPHTMMWKSMTYTFVAKYDRAIVAFEGIGEIDCVRMTAE